MPQAGLAQHVPHAVWRPRALRGGLLLVLQCELRCLLVMIPPSPPPTAPSSPAQATRPAPGMRSIGCLARLLDTQAEAPAVGAVLHRRWG